MSEQEIPRTVPIDDPCPSCGVELFGEKEDLESECQFWLPDAVDGSIMVSRSDEGEIRFAIRFACPNCDQHLRVQHLTAEVMFTQ